MNNRFKLSLILVIVVAVAILSLVWSIKFTPTPMPKIWAIRPHFQPRGDIELFYTFKAVISTINAALLIILSLTYITIYRKTKSDFTIGLIIFSMILLLYALSSNPLVQLVFGFRAFGLGPFAMLPDLFTCIALIILLYLTFKY